MAIECVDDLAAGASYGGGVTRPRTITDLLFMAEQIINTNGSGLNERAMPGLVGELVAVRLAFRALPL